MLATRFSGLEFGVVGFSDTWPELRPRAGSSLGRVWVLGLGLGFRFRVLGYGVRV